METRNHHTGRVKGILTALDDGTITEVFSVIETYEGNLGDRARPIWAVWTYVVEVDFKGSQLSEDTMKKKGCLILKLRDGSELQIAWRDGAWHSCSPNAKGS